jgi:phage gp16-like protein
MNNAYQTYARTAARLCARIASDAGDIARCNERLSRLYNKISQSQLTVYQKERLLTLLEHTRMAVGDGHAAKPKRSRKQAGATHHKSELLAA